MILLLCFTVKSLLWQKSSNSQWLDLLNYVFYFANYFIIMYRSKQSASSLMPFMMGVDTRRKSD